MGAWLPGVRSEERIVAHADMDCFYASCERLREPALEGEALVVGMGYESGETNGAVATASYEARAFGVESAQAITEALSRLPRKRAAATDSTLDIEAAGFYRPVDMAFYESVSEEVREILHAHAETVREVSIDEAYLDLTETTTWEDVKRFAHELKERIREEVGVIASIGVAPTMSTAKIASDAEKPDGLVIVHPDEVEEFLAPVTVEDLHGVGPVTARTLRERGIETAGDLASADRRSLISEFGERGADLYDRARGEDERVVTPRGRPKSLSRESAFAEPMTDMSEIETRVLTLAAAVAERATRKNALYRTIGIKVVTPPFDVNTRARSLSGPVDDPDLVERVVHDLLTEFEGQRVRKVGVRVSNLEFGSAAQASLDGWAGTSGSKGEPVDDKPESDGSENSQRGQASFSDFE